MAAGAVELEVRTELVELHNLTRGETVVAVHVKYRPTGERVWRHFNLIPNEGESVTRLHNRAPLAAQLVHAGLSGITPAELVDDVDDGDPDVGPAA